MIKYAAADSQNVIIQCNGCVKGSPMLALFMRGQSDGCVLFTRDTLPSLFMWDMDGTVCIL